MSGIDRKSGVDLGLSVGGDWSRYQSGCSILQATSLGGRCIQVGLQGGSGIQSISGSVVLPRTQSYTRAQSGNCGNEIRDRPKFGFGFGFGAETNGKCNFGLFRFRYNGVPTVSVSAESASGFGAK